jgi:hypothetical protein
MRRQVHEEDEATASAEKWGACTAGNAIYNGSPSPLYIPGFLGHRAAPTSLNSSRVDNGPLNGP